MKKNYVKRALSLALAAAMALSLTACGQKNETPPASSSSGAAEPLGTPPGDPEVIPEGLEIDWNHRYHVEEMAEQMDKLAEAYPDITEKYSIGTSWRERDLWCVKVTDESVKDEGKTGIGILANIHGDERESASCAMYTLWWTLLNSEDEYIQNMLDKYILYFLPSLNPDGYEQSFTIKTRETLHPRDKNNDRVPFNDPWTDIDGDGYIARLYRGTADLNPKESYDGLKRFGMESPDWDGNGILGDDPWNSGIDPNRNFDYTWNYYDITTDVEGTDVIGGDSGDWNGTAPLCEKEVQAITHFLDTTPLDALVSMHGNIQAVLYPWCYRNYDENNPKDADIPFMAETAEKMAAVFSETTGRKYYSLNSWADYPTAAEMIDYSFGKFGTHAYTLECYCCGTPEQNDGWEYVWGNEMPEATWNFYSQDEIREKFNLDPAKITDADGEPLAANEGLWFYTNSYNLCDDAPEDQDIMCKGARDAIMVMIESEPHGDGWTQPDYMK